ncbi:hypothetical protein Bpfe_009414 [Biomphalaria pfeifferi]|uniref:Uncharacterized protein n=1 Tax=Biomphalaria pfeifferi TaxID=112525 RepID=A0AAD8BW28_BIOPF|nr:hypothetical protein Bpfe_009414 [Biomphalaria pfeifferi]
MTSTVNTVDVDQLLHLDEETQFVISAGNISILVSTWRAYYARGVQLTSGHWGTCHLPGWSTRAFSSPALGNSFDLAGEMLQRGIPFPSEANVYKTTLPCYHRRHLRSAHCLIYSSVGHRENGIGRREPTIQELLVKRRYYYPLLRG